MLRLLRNTVIIGCGVLFGFLSRQSLASDDVKVDYPKEVKLMIASFGTIDTQTEVEGWLSDVLRGRENISSSPKLSNDDRIMNPSLAGEVAYVNWKEKKIEYWRESESVVRENTRRAQILMNLKTKVLSDASQRYVPLGRDYLQSAIQRHKAGRLIRIVDRGNMTIQQTEKAIKEMTQDVVNGADCVLSVVLGDREEDTKVIPVDNVGTKIKRTTYRAPYVCKARDLDGNLLFSCNGEAVIKSTEDNVVRSTNGDPARKLIEKVCEEIAKNVVAYFTVELQFKIKVPSGMDVDDVQVMVDGKEVDNEGVRVLACEHVIQAEIEGCKPIRRIVTTGAGEDEVKSVKLNFKK